MKLLRELIIVVLGGVIAGVIAGIFLYHFYNTNPNLYVSCNYSYLGDNISSINLNIENTGEPAINSEVCLVPIHKDSNFTCYYPKDIEKIERGSTTLIFNMKEKSILENFPFKIGLSCNNCKESSIKYSHNCEYIHQ